jgi:hypothetical protein
MAKKITLKEKPIPENIRKKIEELVKKTWGYKRGSWKNEQSDVADYEIIIENSDTQGATSLVRNGGIYDITLHTLRENGDFEEHKFRAKKFADKRMYDATVEFSDELRIASDEGDLTGELEPDGTGMPGIARDHNLPITATANYIIGHDDSELILLEPLINPAIRLTDYIRGLQELENPEKSSSLIEDITKKAIYITTIASTYLTPAQDRSEFKEYSELFGVTNPLEQFVKKYALRDKPRLAKSLFDSNGEIDRERLQRCPILENLVNNYEQDFLTSYHRRTLHMVNRDNHTGNMLVTNTEIDGTASKHAKASFVLTDFDSMYFDLLEEPIAELILTSGIKDQKTIDHIVSQAYDYAKNDLNGSKEQFLISFNTKLTEKYLLRAGRFLEMSEKCGYPPKNWKDETFIDEDGEEVCISHLLRQPTEEETASVRYMDLACRAYTIALQRMEARGMHKTAEAVEAFNDKYMKLCRVNELAKYEQDFHNTLVSIAVA